MSKIKKILEDSLLDYFNYKISDVAFLNMMELEGNEKKSIDYLLTISHGKFLQIPFVSKNIKKYRNGRDFKKEDIGVEEFLNELKKEIISLVSS